jgi:hypothetical protein
LPMLIGILGGIHRKDFVKSLSLFLPCIVDTMSCLGYILKWNRDL